MKRKLLLSTLMLISVLSVNAQYKMVLHQKSGGDVSVLFSNKPVATYEGSNMVITATNATLTFALSNILSLTYGTGTAVESVTVDNATAGPTQVYNIKGQLVKTIPAGKPMQAADLPKGIYIIKNNKTSYKINVQ